DEAEAATRALGITVWSMDRYEADDAMATGAVRFGKRVEQVRLMTPDKDLSQLISGQKVVLVDRMRQRVVDEEELRRRRGIAAAAGGGGPPRPGGGGGARRGGVFGDPRAGGKGPPGRSGKIPPGWGTPPPIHAPGRW